MDNIRDENLKRLAKYIADAMIERAMETKSEDWTKIDTRDHIIGELARCVTLQNLYLDREEYEKCAIMKLRIMDIKDMLNIEQDLDLTNLDGDEI